MVVKSSSETVLVGWDRRGGRRAYQEVTDFTGGLPCFYCINISLRVILHVLPVKFSMSTLETVAPKVICEPGAEARGSMVMGCVAEGILGLGLYERGRHSFLL